MKPGSTLDALADGTLPASFKLIFDSLLPIIFFSRRDLCRAVFAWHYLLVLADCLPEPQFTAF
ncbi:MAG: hypothetical protein HY920_04645 [Elusimicrobia bacterium]|nr:hypothetical protein [Elusimicrobiota bacterium]